MITLCPCGALPHVGPYCIACAPRARLERPQAPIPIMPLVRIFKVRMLVSLGSSDRLLGAAPCDTGGP